MKRKQERKKKHKSMTTTNGSHGKVNKQTKKQTTKAGGKNQRAKQVLLEYSANKTMQNLEGRILEWKTNPRPKRRTRKTKGHGKIFGRTHTDDKRQNKSFAGTNKHPIVKT